MKEDSEELMISVRFALQEASSTIMARGRNMYKNGAVTKEFKRSNNKLTFRVRSASVAKFYTVEIFLESSIIIDTSCTCPYDGWGICKHQIAVLLELKHLINSGEFFANTPENEIYEIIKAGKNISEQRTELLKRKAKWLIDNQALTVHTKSDNYFNIQVKTNKDVYYVELTKEGNGEKIHTKCSCSSQPNNLCEHQYAAIQYITNSFGNDPFIATYEWTKEKEQQLQKYGFNLDDGWERYFKLTFVSKKPVLKPKTNEVIDLDVFKQFAQISDTKLVDSLDNTVSNNKDDYGFAFFIRENSAFYHYILGIAPIYGVLTKDKTRFRSNLNIISFNSIPKELLHQINEETLETFDMLEQYEKKITEFVRSTILDKHTDGDLKKDFTNFKLFIPFINSYYEQLDRVIKAIQNKKIYIELHPSTKLSVRNLQMITVSDKTVETKLLVSQNQDHYSLTVKYFIENTEIKINNQILQFFWLVEHKGELYMWKSATSIILAILFQENTRSQIILPKHQFDTLYRSFILPLQNSISIEFKGDLQIKTEIINPTKVIKLSETGNFLMFYPIIKYADNEASLMDLSTEIYKKNEQELIRIERNKKVEQEFKEFVTSLHPNFNPNSLQDYYFMRIDEVMKNMWFLKFFSRCKEQNVEVYGFNKLKKLKYNPNTPKTNFSIKSGIDWFDLDIAVSFGETLVSLKDIRKAVLKNENMIRLSDDSIGVLPAEWLEKWSPLLKFAEIDDQQVKLAKTHFSIVDILFAQAFDDEKIAAELAEKRQLLESFDKIEQVKIPNSVKADLRNYQKSGLNWLVFLTKFRWGGCLADDMGLGKTLQILALFAYLKSKNRKNSITHLVVAPTSLLFNWEAEVEKFVPNLKVNTYWGINRQKDSADWTDFDVILTTYSTLTNDIELFKEFEFTCAVLDESQAIKNINAQRYKAVMLIKSKFRFALSGTPIENNTLELFAQMQFLNRGMLGNLNFFKDQYSNAIDKNNEPKKAEELKRLIFPFILRRTKEQVATDLPPKTEMILYCTMEEEQRLVYETFKAEFRKTILNKIDNEGLDKSRFHVLDALLKMRQICDSPALLTTEEDYGSSSTKIDELMRHITEKTGTHKVLVFSQFLKMMQMIADRLTEQNIPFVRLDGSTTNRQEVVEQFQTNTDYRVFILSLKAGGLGLNLTAADYVYLVDPWWNPAVETQAIDRTHRIGQTNHVFAYRMICKDTVEEKILQLQKHKKSIADEIISSESSFVKNLTRDDIDALFS